MLDTSKLKAHPNWFLQLEEQMQKHDWVFVRFVVSDKKEDYFPQVPIGKAIEAVPRSNLSGTELKPKVWEHPWRFIPVTDRAAIFLYRQDPRLPKRKLQYRTVAKTIGGIWSRPVLDAGFAVRDYNSGNMEPCGSNWPNGEDDPRFKRKRNTPRGRRKIWLDTLEQFIDFTS